MWCRQLRKDKKETFMKKEFFHQFSEFFPSHALKNTLPSLTVPDQAMSIPEIIAKFTRTGLLPSSVLNVDEGNQEASLEADFDPLDHSPSEFDPKVHQEKLKSLQALKEPKEIQFSEEPKPNEEAS